ncbi:MAG: hypothetical protein K9W44_06655 [Candidatus Lokiarchaeota archaeon]|nr:hypothetical protein [Candidatus Harpocratesius repetitus]
MYYLFIPQNEKEFQLELSSFNLYNGYQEWDIVYPILIKFKVNNFPFKYPVAGPISFLISSWKSHAEQIFNGKKVEDYFITCGCGDPSCEGEEWVIHKEKEHVFWSALNWFQFKKDADEKSFGFFTYLDEKLFFNAWLKLWNALYDDLVKRKTFLGENKLVFKKGSTEKIVLDDKYPRYKKEVRSYIEMLIVRVKDVKEVFQKKLMGINL